VWHSYSTRIPSATVLLLYCTALLYSTATVLLHYCTVLLPYCLLVLQRYTFSYCSASRLRYNETVLYLFCTVATTHYALCTVCCMPVAEPLLCLSLYAALRSSCSTVHLRSSYVQLDTTQTFDSSLIIILRISQTMKSFLSTPSILDFRQTENSSRRNFITTWWHISKRDELQLVIEIHYGHVFTSLPCHRSTYSLDCTTVSLVYKRTATTTLYVYELAAAPEVHQYTTLLSLCCTTIQ
jgi:hypothetical protein